MRTATAVTVFTVAVHIVPAITGKGLLAQTKADDAKPKATTGTEVTKPMSMEERMRVLEEEIEKSKVAKAQREYKSVGGMGPAASQVYHSQGGMTLGGYGEVIYNDFKSNRKTDNIDALRFILYGGYRFNEYIVMNSEIEYEHAGIEQQTVVTDTSGTPVTKVTKKDINQGEVFVEFAYIDLKFSEAAQLSLGLNLIPVGIMNYMHEPTTFYSVARPQTEQIIIPSTWREIGAILHGQLIKDVLTYRTGIVNGGRAAKFSDTSWIKDGRSKGSKAKGEDFAYVANLEYKGLPGLTLGTSYYRADNGQREIAPVNWTVRVQPSAPTSDPTGLFTAYSEVTKTDVTARIRTHLAEAHVEYKQGPWSARGLFARGWMNEDDARAVNKATGKNVGKVVEGSYFELGFNVLSLTKSDQKLIAFARHEMVNTQRRTVERYAGGRDDIMDLVCTQLGCKTTSQLTNGNKDVGVINNADAGKELYGVRGVADRTNDQRIVTFGLAYYPHDNLALKVDFERHNSASKYHKDIETRNSSNNKIDQLNLGVSFIF